jgi:hypothetical protein
LQDGIAELSLSCRTLFLRNRAQCSFDDPPKVFGDGDVRVGSVGALHIDSRRLQTLQQASELLGDEAIIEARSRF